MLGRFDFSSMSSRPFVQIKMTPRCVVSLSHSGEIGLLSCFEIIHGAHFSSTRKNSSIRRNTHPWGALSGLFLRHASGSGSHIIIMVAQNSLQKLDFDGSL